MEVGGEQNQYKTEDEEEIKCLDIFKLKLHTHHTDLKRKITITWTDSNSCLFGSMSGYDWIAMYSIEDRNNINDFIKYKWIDKSVNSNKSITFTAHRIGIFFFRYFVFDKTAKRIKSAVRQKRKEKSTNTSCTSLTSTNTKDVNHLQLEELKEWELIKPITIQRPEVFKKSNEEPQDREHQQQLVVDQDKTNSNLFETLYSSPFIVGNKTKDLVTSSPETLRKKTKNLVSKTIQKKDTIKRFHSESFLFMSSGPYYLVAQSEPILISPIYRITGRQISSEQNKIQVETECVQVSGNKDYSNCWIGMYRKEETNNKAYVQFKWLSTIEASNHKNRVVWELEVEGEWDWRVFPLRKEYIHVSSFALLVKEDTFDDIHNRFAPPPVATEEANVIVTGGQLGFSLGDQFGEETGKVYHIEAGKNTMCCED